MGPEAAVPPEGEVRAVAEVLGRRPDELAAVKLPGPGRLVESPLTVFDPPELDGFDSPKHLEIEWVGARHPHPAARYDSRDGSLIVVSHETDPEIFFVLLGGAAASTTVLRGANDFMQWVRSRRASSSAPPDVVNAEPIQFWFVENGSVRRHEVLPPDAAEE